MASTVQTQKAREIQALIVRRLQSQLRGNLLKRIPHLLFIPSQKRKLQKILFRFEFMKEMGELKALSKETVPPIAVAVAPPLADASPVNLLAQHIYPYQYPYQASAPPGYAPQSPQVGTPPYGAQCSNRPAGIYNRTR